MLAENLKRMREKACLSQMRLSLISEVPQTTISAIESGTIPTVETAAKLAQALNVSIDDLLKEPTKEGK